MTQSSEQLATTCPDDNTVAAYLDAALTPEQKSGFEQHASTCASCRELLGLAISLGGPEVAPVVEPAAELGRRPLWNWRIHPATALAVLSIIAVGAAVLLVRTGKQEPPKQIASVQAPARTESTDTLSAHLSENRAAQDKAVIEERREPQAPALRRVKERSVPQAPAASAPVGEFKSKAPAEAESGQPAAVVPMQTGAVGAAKAVAGPPPSGKEEPGGAARRDATVSEEMALQEVSQLNAADESRPAAAPSRPAAYRWAPGPLPAEAIRTLGEADRSAIPYPRQTVGELLFYRVGAYWIDSRCIDGRQAPVLELKSDSSELRSILSSLPDLSRLKAAGVRVMVSHEGKTWVLPEQ